MKRLRFPRIVKPFENKEKIILRDYLSMQRTTLANERTLFSYIRTSLYTLIGGIGILNLEEFVHLHWLGYLALAISGLLIVYGLIRFWVLKRRLSKLYKKAGMVQDDPLAGG